MAGKDTLVGGEGSDTITGGAGANLMLARVQGLEALAPDTISDFGCGADILDLGALSSAKLGFVGESEFTAAGQVRLTREMYCARKCRNRYYNEARFHPPSTSPRFHLYPKGTLRLMATFNQ